MNVHSEKQANYRGSGAFAGYGVMIGKELLELYRSLKLLWVPLVFAALGIMQPVTTYFMPVLLEKAGNLPEGSVFEIPLPSGAQVMAETLSQFGTIGALILVLVFMGTVSGERNSGSASMILVKPVSTFSYLLSKWTSMNLLGILSLLVGYLASWYYTWLLIEGVPLAAFVSSFLLYALWLSLLLTLTLLLSTCLRSASGAASAALGSGLLLTLLSNLLPKYAGWLPGALPKFAAQASGGSLVDYNALVWSLGATALAMGGILLVSNSILRRSPAVD